MDNASKPNTNQYIMESYGMISSRSTHEKIVCSYYIENNKALTLTNKVKASFFYYHRRFLSMDHKYIKNKKGFFVSRVEKDVVLSCFSGEELHDVV